MKLLQRVVLTGATLAPACQAFVGDYKIEPQTVNELSIDIDALCTVERDRFDLDLALTSDEQLSSLNDYYERANPELVQHLLAIGADYSAGGQRQAVTYVLGDAGVGKSWAMRNALAALGEQKCEVTPAELVAVQASDTQLADLRTTEHVVFNSLPAFDDTQAVDLTALLNAAGCFDGDALKPVVVIDGIDEIHDSSAEQILRAVDDYVLGAPSGFIQFIIAGRPEGFRPWLTHPDRNENDARIVTQFSLQAPEYRTRGDLEFRLRGYLDYVGQLEAIEGDGDFDRYLASLVSAAQRLNFVGYSLGNLALGNFVLEHTYPEAEESEEQIKSGVFDGLLARNAETHGRPGNGDSLDSVYRTLLEDIAARYIDVDAHGEFSVATTDKIAVAESADGSDQVAVRDTLIHSGIAYLTSASASSTRFRFSPFWVHAFLVERRNQRLSPNYQFRGCE